MCPAVMPQHFRDWIQMYRDEVSEASYLYRNAVAMGFASTSGSKAAYDAQHGKNFSEVIESPFASPAFVRQGGGFGRGGGGGGGGNMKLAAEPY